MALDEHSEERKRSRTAKSGAKAASAARADADDAALDQEVASLRYEEALDRLESIIERVEHGEIGLEETLAEYRRGRALLRRCQSILDVADQEIRRLSLSDLEQLSPGRGPSKGPGNEQDPSSDRRGKADDEDDAPF
jgi:exodeoxyribonuclease VII small subunit